MKRRYWTPAEEALLREHYATARTDELARRLGRTPDQVLRKAFDMGLKKSRDLVAQMAREAIEDPAHPARGTRFQKGLQPWNKGTNWTAGGRSAQTRFRPGNKPHTWQPIGTFRVVNNKNGGPELQRKVNDDHGPSSVRWKPVARLVWEAAHGPVPNGRIVVFKPGMRTVDPELVTLERLECITRTELMQRNTIRRLPPEFAEVARLKAVLHKAINHRARKEGQNP